MNTRTEFFQRVAQDTGTDKLSHGYMPSYSEFLPEKCRMLLEIGVAHGASAKMWHILFGNDCDIHILDLFQNPEFKSARWCRRQHFVPYQCDQSDVLTMADLVKDKFEIIIDDGSHRSDHQVITFKHLFFENLQSGGVYVIEDLHCCKEPFYWGGGLVKGYPDTALGMLHHFKNTGKIVNPYFSFGLLDWFQEVISRVEIVNDKIAFIWKK